MRNKSLGEIFAKGIPGFAIKAASGNVKLTDGNFWSSFFGATNWSGKAVTVNTALQLSAVMACVRLISRTMATLPFGLFRREADGTPVLATDHDLYRLLHSQPNADMTAAIFWQAMVASMLLWGNAYAQKYTTTRGAVTSIEFLRPEFVIRRVIGGDVDWTYNDPISGPRTVPTDSMWHMPNFTLDGAMGVSQVQYGANVFGTAMATNEASALTFKNAMRSPGIIGMDSTLTPDQRDQVRAHVKTVAAAGGVMVLEKGAKYQPLSMNPDDAELLASRAYNVEEIARWFGVDPSLIGHGGKDSNWGTGLEEKMGWLVALVLRPLAVNIEQSVSKDVLSAKDRVIYSGEFALEGLLRGDSAARASFYSTMAQNGLMTRDEIRRKESLPMMGGNAAVLTVQSNLLPLDKLGVALAASTPVSPAEMIPVGGARKHLYDT